MGIQNAFEAAVGKAFSSHNLLERPAADASTNASLGSSFRPISFDFAALTKGRVFTDEGAQLLFLRRGSFPGARLDVSIGGSLFTGLRPGCRILAPFKNLEVKRSLAFGSIVYQTNVAADRLVQPVNLLAIAPGCDFREPDPRQETDGRLWPLLGDSQVPGTSGWSAFAENGDVPDTGGAYGTDDSLWFNPFGFKKLRIYLDGGAANTMTDCVLTPWVRIPGSSGPAPTTYFHYSLPLAAISVVAAPDIGGYNAGFSGYRYRVLTIDNPLYSHRNVVPSVASNAAMVQVDGAGGEMTFQLTELNPGPATAIRIAVDGVEE